MTTTPATVDAEEVIAESLASRFEELASWLRNASTLIDAEARFLSNGPGVKQSYTHSASKVQRAVLELIHMVDLPRLTTDAHRADVIREKRLTEPQTPAEGAVYDRVGFIRWEPPAAAIPLGSEENTVTAVITCNGASLYKATELHGKCSRPAKGYIFHTTIEGREVPACSFCGESIAERLKRQGYAFELGMEGEE